MKFYIVVALLLVATGAFAQTEGVIQMIRHDIQTEKVSIMTASLPLTSKEGDAFWPIYRDYNAEMAKIGDRRIAILKKLAESDGNLDAKTVEKGMKESFSISNDRNSLLKKYYGKVSKAVGVVKAARFVQIENQLLTLLDAQLIDQVPLLKEKPATEEKK